ncbi:hypothetical protein PR048_015807 [Dryococelus australis]|uniref:Uncharacterized protein n=1 Tax=Dryococelus australis TaxID=614101 RepID=A0ABQ9HHZ3_9NEOP|nr:hypothetical protein PR048_015807 [Dryococelus australis]
MSSLVYKIHAADDAVVNMDPDEENLHLVLLLRRRRRRHPIVVDASINRGSIDEWKILHHYE